ncbi:(R)-1-hydroxy-2-aminoethylphosphonate ammonia-lyase [Megalodesulfovibrio gigas]|uniref:Putative 4-aminobutyrate aminotransferase family protein n=1 Tax=Megalodesulfovibrio gigas (strain ATCC 19364 / DSM 1382 / NCIMB 9332 / VKM B-1759) TaxID=1121448 RepID=T2G7W8_MEGG1|nr:aspartate aminotransferase family protein [Megalodesulfovibrio gigas]AGW12670.1 putative 4-aminobutyrate aminotransferase family protein [Megalodesulfovibrio gigas DSM 1382 = ATCC 19364]
MRAATHPDDLDHSEGDLNSSPHRRAWQEAMLSPEARALLDRDAAVFLHQSLSTPCLDVLTGATGAHLTSLDGRDLLDFHGNSVHQLGHGHPRILEALTTQLETLAFCPRRFTHAGAVTLAERLTQRMTEADPQGEAWKLLLAPGGSLAVGMALKLARLATGRFKFVSCWGAFHGASLDAISVSGEAIFRQGIGPLLPNCGHVPAPDPRHCLLRPDGDCAACNLACARYLDAVFEHEGDVAAFIAEPMRCTTVSPPPPGYWQAVRQSCDRHGVLLIFDEIPTSLGRTGRFFCWEHWGVAPDMLLLGKGLGGGIMPQAALLARAGLDVVASGAAPQAALGHYTHEKSPLGCAAALATLEVLEQEQLVERSQTLGHQTLARLQAMVGTVPGVIAARGLGLQLALELDNAGLADRVLYECLARGLSFKVSAGTVLTLAPPLTIADADLHRALDILEAAIRLCAGRP